MTKVSNLLEEVLYEQEKEKSLKLFYNVNMFIQEFKDEKPKEPEPVAEPTVPVEPVAQTVPATPVAAEPVPTIPATEPTSQPVESVNDVEKMINEEIFKTRSNGMLTVTKEDGENIQTLNDLLDYLSDQSTNGKKLINEVAIEIILNVVEQKENVADIINKGDKVLLDIDYGFDRDDSIGIKVNKVAGSDSMSVTMKKDNKILPGQFNLPEFNKQLIFYRNSLME